MLSDCLLLLAQLLVRLGATLGWSSTVVIRWHARNALVHLPMMMPATPLRLQRAAYPHMMPSSASRCTQETTSAYASFRDPTPAMSSSKSRSVAQYTIYDQAVCRLGGVRIALKISSRYFFIFAAILAAILNSGDRIPTPISGMVLHHLITHTKWYYVTL